MFFARRPARSEPSASGRLPFGPSFLPGWVDGGLRSLLALGIFASQLNVVLLAFFLTSLVAPSTARAARLGTSTASAGSAPPPAATSIESFQPDLFTGRAGTSVPIAVPSGRHGVQPSLALGYSSSSRNSWVGVGWNLDLGFIERSTRKGVPSYTDGDTFTFSFSGVSSDLVRISDGSFRAKDEGGFMHFQFSSADGWTVRDKSGTRFFFGRSDATRVVDGSKVFRWHLDRVADTNGNTMTATYVKFDGLVYPASIDYAGHETSGLAAPNRVSFTVENRTDIESSYRSGFQLKTSKRLSRVDVSTTVSGNLSLARRYDLSYQQSQRTKRSLLTSVTQRGADGTTALPPVTFTYQQAPATYAITSNNAVTGKIAWNVRIDGGFDRGHDNFGPVGPYGPFPGGANFGPAQVVDSQYSTGSVSVSVSSSTGGFRVNAGQDNLVHAWTAVYLNAAGTRNLTYDGGEAIAVVWVEDSSGLRGPYWPDNFSGIQFKTGWSLVHFISYHQHQSYSFGLGAPFASLFDVMNPTVLTEPHLAGDVDGNGITDIIGFDPAAGRWTASLAQATAFSPAVSWLNGFGGSSSLPLLGDWNGDGRTDVASYDSGSWRFASSTGTQFLADSIPSLSFGVGAPLAGDFNGDGIIDLGTYRRGYWEIAMGSGSSFSPAMFSLSKDVVGVGGGSVPPTVRASARELMELGGVMQDGTYSIDPDGPGGQAPFNVFCLMSLAGGGWTRLTEAVSSSVLNIDENLEREYLYENQGRWYRSPVNRLKWDWRDGFGKDAYGTWFSSQGGSFQIAAGNSPERTYFGVSASSGPGNTIKCYLGSDSDKDPTNGLVEIYSDQPNVFGSNPRGNVAVYIRERSSPQKFWFGSVSASHLTGDFNGDGITDMAFAEAGQCTVAFGDGKKFVEHAPWGISGFPGEGLQSADFNGDGLSDLAFFDRATGRVMVGYCTRSPLAGDFSALAHDGATSQRAQARSYLAPSSALLALTLALVFFTASADAAPASLPIPRGEPQLFVDDSRIAHAEGVKRTLRQPRKDDAGKRPVLAITSRFGHGANLQANGSIVFDPRLGRWVMFSLLFVPALKAEAPDGWQRVAVVRHTSADGLAWTADALDGIEQVFPRTRADLFDAASGAHAANVDAITVWHDATDREWPYKAWFWLTRLPPGRAGAWFHRSRDGRRFERGELALTSRQHTVMHDGRRLVGPADTSRFTFDPVSRRFLVTLKFYAFHPEDVDLATGNAFRSRAFLWADRIDRPIDARGLTAIPLVPAASAGDEPFDEYYDTTTFRYGSHWLGALKIWHGRGDYAWSAAGCAYLKLMTSTDGLAWRRVALPNDAGVAEVWVANGSPEGGAAEKNDAGYITTFNSPPLRIGDELIHYYGASSYGKNAGAEKRLIGGGIFRARSRLDGFVSVDAGRLTTPPLRPEGDTLRVNSRGRITIEALDPSGTVLGTARLSGDGVRQPVGLTRGSLRAEVALRFTVAPGSELYSFVID